MNKGEGGEITYGLMLGEILGLVGVIDVLGGAVIVGVDGVVVGEMTLELGGFIIIEGDLIVLGLIDFLKLGVFLLLVILGTFMLLNEIFIMLGCTLFILLLECFLVIYGNIPNPAVIILLG